jgi:hypothetical protein
MRSYLRFLRVWTKVSFLGVTVITAGLTLIALCDLVFDLGYNYRIDDLLLGLVICLSTIAIYALTRRVFSEVEEK